MRICVKARETEKDTPPAQRAESDTETQTTDVPTGARGGGGGGGAERTPSAGTTCANTRQAMAYGLFVARAPASRPPPQLSSLGGSQWSCAACTLLNDERLVECSACGGRQRAATLPAPPEAAREEGDVGTTNKWQKDAGAASDTATNSDSSLGTSPSAGPTCASTRQAMPYGLFVARAPSGSQ